VPRAANSGALLVVSPGRAYPVGSAGDRPRSRRYAGDPAGVGSVHEYLADEEPASATVSMGKARRRIRGIGASFYEWRRIGYAARAKPRGAGESESSAMGRVVYPDRTRCRRSRARRDDTPQCQARGKTSRRCRRCARIRRAARSAAARVAVPIDPASLIKPRPNAPPPPKLDDVELLGIPDSTEKYTRLRINDLYNPPTGIRTITSPCRRSSRMDASR